MSGFYFTKLRLTAPDFPGQITLFVNLKKPVYFRNAALSWIQEGGWAELPKDHFTAFMKALDEGWVRGERMWTVNTPQFTRQWHTPTWVNVEPNLSPERLNLYVERGKTLLSRGILSPFLRAPAQIPSNLLTYIIEGMEGNKLELLTKADLYATIFSNLEEFPNPELAHRTFNLLLNTIESNYRYAQIDILNGLSKMNPNDRKTFLSWLFKSPKQLEQVKDANYSVSDIVLNAVLNGEVWYREKSNENQGAVSTDTCPPTSTTEVCATPQ